MSTEEALNRERRRLLHGAGAEMPAAGLGALELFVVSESSAEAVLDLVRQVLLRINRASRRPWPSLDQWRWLLPRWFVARAGDELTREQVLEYLDWLALLPSTEARRIEEEQPWSLGDWLHWMHPERREWYWLGGVLVEERRALVRLEIHVVPAAWDAFRWLARTAGASDVCVAE